MYTILLDSAFQKTQSYKDITETIEEAWMKALYLYIIPMLYLLNVLTVLETALVQYLEDSYLSI